MSEDVSMSRRLPEKKREAIKALGELPEKAQEKLEGIAIGLLLAYEKQQADKTTKPAERREQGCRKYWGQ